MRRQSRLSLATFGLMSDVGHDPQLSDEDTSRALIFVRGHVQRVGFRWWTRARALEMGLAGHARNLNDGRVEVCAQGARMQIDALRRVLAPEGGPTSRPGRVDGLTVQWHAPRSGLTGFVER